MKTINLTPHKINIHNKSKALVAEIAPSGVVAKIDVGRTQIDEINGYPVFETEVGEPVFTNKVGEPVEFPVLPVKNTVYIVSGIFLANCPREDFYAPGELLRDDDGIPIGCIGLTK